jgi:hypothetical protein
MAPSNTKILSFKISFENRLILNNSLFESRKCREEGFFLSLPDYMPGWELAPFPFANALEGLLRLQRAQSLSLSG